MYDKFIVCNYLKPYKKISYFIYCYNKKGKIISIVKFQEKNTNNSSSGSSNTSEKSFDRFDLAVSNFMVFLLLFAILLYKFSPKVKSLIKLMTLDKDEV